MLFALYQLLGFKYVIFLLLLVKQLLYAKKQSGSGVSITRFAVILGRLFISGSVGERPTVAHPLKTHPWIQWLWILPLLTMNASGSQCKHKSTMTWTGEICAHVSHLYTTISSVQEKIIEQNLKNPVKNAGAKIFNTLDAGCVKKHSVKVCKHFIHCKFLKNSLHGYCVCLKAV